MTASMQHPCLSSSGEQIYFETIQKTQNFRRKIQECRLNIPIVSKWHPLLTCTARGDSKRAADYEQMLCSAADTTVTHAMPSLELVRVHSTYPEAVGLPLPGSCQEVEERQEQEEEDQSYIQSTGTPANQTGKHFSQTQQVP